MHAHGRPRRVVQGKGAWRMVEQWTCATLCSCASVKALGSKAQRVSIHQLHQTWMSQKALGLKLTPSFYHV